MRAVNIHARTHTRSRFWWIGAALIVGMLASIAPSMAASTTAPTVVTADLMSATNLNTSACGSGDYNDNQFGPLTPGTNNTIDSCSIVFGSTNDTSMLRTYQSDGVGDAMWRSLSGLDGAWGTSGIGDDVDSGLLDDDHGRNAHVLAARRQIPCPKSPGRPPPA